MASSLFKCRSAAVGGAVFASVMLMLMSCGDAANIQTSGPARTTAPEAPSVASPAASEPMSAMVTPPSAAAKAPDAAAMAPSAAVPARAQTSGGTSAAGAAGRPEAQNDAGARTAMMPAGSGAVGQPEAMGATGTAQTCSASSTLRPGNTNGMLDVNGMSRSYVVHVPASYKGNTQVPLLVDMHGLFGNGQGQLSGSGTAAVSDREGFIAVYPNGIDNAWNVGPCCTYDRNVDDVAFMRALVDKLETQACIDASRVYATGVSMGGGMSHYLGCEAADTFAAVAPAAFDLLEENTCMPSRPIAVLSSRGTADNIVPYAGGASTPPNGVPTTIHFRGAEGTFKEWARINGCTDKPSSSYDACQSYTACNAGVEVTLCTEQGGGHTYGDPERAWKMLSKYKLP